jgi:hypothetical protein
MDCRWEIAQVEQFENNWELILGRLRSADPDSSLVEAPKPGAILTPDF